jgi:Flp pilus assembly protein TadG
VTFARGETHPGFGYRGLWSHARRAQSTVEVALTAPLLLLLLGGVTDIGRAMYFQESVSSAARQLVQVAAFGDTTTGTDSHPISSAGLRACQLNPGATQATVARLVPDATGDAIATVINRAAMESSPDGTAAASVLNNGTGSGATRADLTWNCDAVRTEPLTDAHATVTDPAATGSASFSVTLTYTYLPLTPMFRSLLGGSVPRLLGKGLGYNQF